MDATNVMQSAARGRWAVAAMFLTNGFMAGSWAPQIPLVLTRLSITESTLGLLIFCFGIGALISMPWCGWLMARFGQRPVLSTFGLLQAFGLLLVVLSPTVALSAVTMIAFGAFIGCTDVAMNAATVTVERKLGRAVMSSMHGFWSLGGFAGGGLGGFMLQSLGPTTHAAIVAVLAFGVAVIAVPNILHDPERPAGADQKKRVGLSIPTSPTPYLLGLMAMFLFVSEGAVLDWGALYMTQEKGADLGVAGLAYAFFAGAMALMRFVGDSVRNRFGGVLTLRVCSFLSAVAMLAAALAPTPFLVILAFAICGLAVANTVPIVFSAAGNLPGISSGAAMSVATTMGYAGILFAPSSIGFVAEETGFSPVFIALSGLLLVVAALANLAKAADFDHGETSVNERAPIA
ncbi:MAG TPA: MFS transporter [Rhizobiaceae bacterium]|nr:MFS transporter [Rhizobiaceae bacterium]